MPGKMYQFLPVREIEPCCHVSLCLSGIIVLVLNYLEILDHNVDNQ